MKGNEVYVNETKSIACVYISIKRYKINCTTTGDL